MTIPKQSKRISPVIWVTGIMAFSLLGTVGCGEKSSSNIAGGEPAAAGAYQKGPHGGRLLSDGALQVEVTIYERGVPPQFRVYLYQQGVPLRAEEVSLQIELNRLGGRVDKIAFKPESDYLVGDQVVEEPHSFDVNVMAQRGAVKHEWKYSQSEGRVELSDDAVRTSEIEIETAGAVTMRSVIELPGEVTLNGDRVAHIVARTTGVVREIFKNQGDRVGSGEVIAVVDSRDLAEAKQRFIETAQHLEFARRAFEREAGLWKKNIASEAEYLLQERGLHEAELKHRSARQQLEALGISPAALQGLLEQPDSILTRFELRAPFAGVVIDKKVATGQAVTEEKDLFTVADLSTVWVNITVYAKDLDAVKVGQEVTIRAEDLDAEIKSKIVYLGALVGGEARAAEARVVVPDPDGKWRPGLYVKARIVREEVVVPVVVKAEGVQKFRDWDVVFVRVGNLFEARPLQLGRRDGGWVEVVSGLSAGERYAAANSFVLKADVGKSGASHDH